MPNPSSKRTATPPLNSSVRRTWKVLWPPKKNASSDKDLVRALSAENKRLHSKLVRLEVKEITYKNKIAALQAEIKSGNNRQLRKILEEISDEGSSLPVKK